MRYFELNLHLQIVPLPRLVHNSTWHSFEISLPHTLHCLQTQTHSFSETTAVPIAAPSPLRRPGLQRHSSCHANVGRHQIGQRVGLPAIFKIAGCFLRWTEGGDTTMLQSELRSHEALEDWTQWSTYSLSDQNYSQRGFFAKVKTLSSCSEHFLFQTCFPQKLFLHFGAYNWKCHAGKEETSKLFLFILMQR